MYTNVPATSEAIAADRTRRFARAVAVGQQARTYPKALRAMAAHGVGVRDDKLVDQWADLRMYGVVMLP